VVDGDDQPLDWALGDDGILLNEACELEGYPSYTPELSEVDGGGNGESSSGLGLLQENSWGPTGWVLLIDGYAKQATVMEYIENYVETLLSGEEWLRIQRISFREKIPASMNYDLWMAPLPSGVACTPVYARSLNTHVTDQVILNAGADLTEWPTAGKALVSDNEALDTVVVEYTRSGHVLTLSENLPGGMVGYLTVAPLPTSSLGAYVRLTKQVTDTTKFPANFRNALAHRLASELAVTLTANAKKQETELAIYEAILHKAGSNDSMQGRPMRGPSISRLLNARNS
jgi:hypothetical protein